MDEPNYTPFPPVSPAAAGRKVCSAESKPPKGYFATRRAVEPQVHHLPDGSFVVEHEGRFVKYARGANGAVAAVRPSEEPKG